MSRLGLIAGTVLYGAEIFAGAKREIVETPHGPALVLVTDHLAYVPRHGLEDDHYLLPHRINHAANLTALKNLGVREVVGLNSTGSLRMNLKPGTIVIPDDFISLADPATTVVDYPRHITPALSAELAGRLAEAARRAGVEVVRGGVYWQTRGPRLETRAEIRFLSNFADLVGMTLGSEAACAGELDLGYAALCSVDNYGHGLADQPLTEAEIKEGAKVNRQKMMAVVEKFLEIQALEEPGRGPARPR